MKQFDVTDSRNPVYNTVTGLINTTFDPTNVVINRGASEGQVKYVYDLIKALQDWLDENGCSDDPYAIIRQKVDELEEAIGICCANPQDRLIQMLTDRLNALQTAQEECCQAMTDTVYQELVARMDALEDSIENGCQSDTPVTDTCDGNIITVSFSWNNVSRTSGQATASSSMSDHNIVGYYFLAKNNGVYYKSATAGMGDFGYTINASGQVQMYSTPTRILADTIVAVDNKGCEGTIYIGPLYTGFAVGG